MMSIRWFAVCIVASLLAASQSSLSAQERTVRPSPSMVVSATHSVTTTIVPRAVAPTPPPASVAANNGYRVVAGPSVLKIQEEKSAFDHLPVNPIVPQPYAYGWFGSQSHPHWSRQFGSRGRYTQWTLK